MLDLFGSLIFLCFLLIPFFLIIIIFIFGPMPGRIARRRNHPHAKAIKTCGWVAILSSSPTAWTLAMRWAHQDFSESQGNLKQEILAIAKKEGRNNQHPRRR